MKRMILAAIMAAMFSTGCRLVDRAFCGPGGGGHCDRCDAVLGDGGCRGCGLGGRFRDPQVAGPPTGQVTYPYYTNRGPRDFLAESPRGIGP